MLGGIGAQELILIFLVVLLLFGAKRIPDIAQGLGKGLREFRGAIQDTKDQMNKAVEMPDLNGKTKGTSTTTPSDLIPGDGHNKPVQPS